MPRKGKKWYLSKGLWLGVIAIATAGLEAYRAGADPAAIALACFGVAAILIRAKTFTAITK